MNKASTIGLDLAKQVFQVHGADATGAVVFRKRLRRTGVLQFFASQAPCELRWKPALLRIIGAVSFPALAMKFGSFPQHM
jgi:transposase